MIKRFSQDTNYQKLITSSRWAKLRNQYIKQHPICEVCGHLAEEIHHKVPLDKYRNDTLKMEQLCFDEDNLQALCRSCHIKAHQRLGKYKNIKENVQELKNEMVSSFFERYLK